MRKILATFLLFLFVQLGESQSIIPTTSSPICPTPNYSDPNLNSFSPNVQRFEIDFGTDPSNYTVNNYPSNSSDPYKPIGCRVIQNITIKSSSEPTIGVFYMAFEDQRSTTPKFTIQSKLNLGVYNTYSYPKIRSLKGITPTINFSSDFALPLCTTSKIPYFCQPVYYQGTDDNKAFGAEITSFEYSVPKGWMVDNIVSTSPDNYIVAGPNAVITAGLINNGPVKIRPQSDCNPKGISGEFASFTVGSTSRPLLNLKVDGQESVTINCAQIVPRTFTVENMNSTTCASYTWNIKGTWLDNNGQQVPTSFTTSTNSITLTPVSTLSQPPGNVGVVVTAGNSTFSDEVNVTFVNNNQPLSISGYEILCDQKPYQLTMAPGYRMSGTATWAVGQSNLATLSSDPNYPQSDKNVLVTRIGSSIGNLSLYAYYSSNECNVNNSPVVKNISVGDPTESPVILGTDCIQGTTETFTITTANPCEECTYEWTLIKLNDGNATSSKAYIVPFGEISTKVYGIATGNYSSWASYSLGCTITNTCAGTSTTVWHPFKVTPRGGYACTNTVSLYSVAPNPTSGNITVTSTENAIQVEGGNRIEEVQIYDLHGTLKETRKFNKAKSANLNVSELNNGIYIIKISNNGYKETHQVVVQK